MTLYDTALIQCPKVYELHDRCGLAHGLLTHLLSGAVAKGYDVVACPDPMPPSVWPICSFPRRGWPSSPSSPVSLRRKNLGGGYASKPAWAAT